MATTHIEITPGVRGGKPRIKGTRITVSDVAIWHLQVGQSLEVIAGDYHLSLASVHAAMTYYYDHRTTIDRAIKSERFLARKLRKQNPSPLKAKQRTLTRG